MVHADNDGFLDVALPSLHVLKPCAIRGFQRSPARGIPKESVELMRYQRLSFRPPVQVPLLLSMGENELGLKKAILSGEDDLVYLSINHIEREAGSTEKGREAFCELMHAHPEALRLLKVSTVSGRFQTRSVGERRQSDTSCGCTAS